MPIKNLSGTPLNDNFFIGDDDHFVNLSDGNNRLIAGDGNNSIEAGDGNNRVSVGHGVNAVLAGHGMNQMFLGDGQNTITMGDGRNRIVVGDGNNQVDLGDGDNRVTAGDGDNNLKAGLGDDRIFLGAGANIIDAGDGDNVVKAFGHGNRITTGEGNDVVALIGDAQLVHLGDGADRLSIDGSDNTVYAGDGGAKLTISGERNTVTTGNGDDKITLGDGVQEVWSGWGYDRILFGDGDVVINDVGGNTRISGGDGSIELNLGIGDHRIVLGDGEHLIRADNGDHRITLGDGYISLVVGDGNSTIRTGDGEVGRQSFIWTGNGADKIIVGDHNFTINSNAGDNSVRTGDGYNSVTTGAGNDTIITGAGGDRIETGAGDDIIRSGDGDDFLVGGAGNDFLLGGAGMFDTAGFAGSINDYQIEILSNGKVTVTASAGTLHAGDVDTLTDIEYLNFTDSGPFLIPVSDVISLALSDDILAADDQGPANISMAALLANDTISGETVVSVSPESAFGAEVSFDGTTVTYTPGDMWRHLGAGETATDSFTYSVQTSGWQFVTATVDVTITGVDDPLVAGDDALASSNVPPSAYLGGGEITLQATLTNSNGDPRSTALPDGGFATVWAGPGELGGTALQLSIVSDSGVVTTRDLQLTDSGVLHLGPDITATTDGTLAVTWRYRDLRAGVDEARFQFFDLDGHPTSEILVLDGENVPGQTDVTALDNGNVLVTWRLFGSGSESYNVEGAIYTSTGNVVADVFSLTQNPAGYESSPDAAALPGGGFVTAYSAENRVELRIFDATGNASEAEQIVHTPSTGYVHYPHVFSAPDGKFGVLWFEQATANGQYSANHRLQLFDADAKLTGDIVDISTTVPFSVGAEAAWLSDGRFVVTWIGGDNNNNDIFARVFEPDGTAHTDEFYVDTGLTGHQQNPDILVLSEGRFAITWSDETGFGTARHRMKAKIFEPEGGFKETAFVTEDEIADILVSDLLANDWDVDHFDLSIIDTSDTSESGAAVWIDEERGIVQYDPTTATALQALNAGEIVEDYFTYSVTNGDGDVQTAVVSILVGGVDDIVPSASISIYEEFDLIV